MFYFENINSKKPKGFIDLSTKFLVADALLVGNYGHFIKIIFSEKIYELQIEKLSEKEDWKKNLLEISSIYF